MNRIDLPRTLVTRILQQIQRNAATRQGRFAAGNIAAGTWHVHDVAGQTPDAETVVQAGNLYLGIYLGTQGVLQMQGWRLENGKVARVDIGIRESGET